MMKKFTILFFVFFTSNLLFYPPFVFAHVLKANGSVGAVMHVTPDDDPIAGENSDFYFEFKDKEGRFKPANCKCIVTILDSSGKEVLNQPLFANNSDPSLTNASLSFTFPQKDVYKIKISGKPLVFGQFNDFNLEYDLRVERTSENSGSASDQTTGDTNNKSWVFTHIPHLVGGFLVLGFLIFALLKERLGKGKVGT